ncbi:MAG TPA: hypothetical protein VEU96_03110 [Bryobacteraceae bacterium]|nr:hypothetical protein [Bryobacteraceae bacterium]
MIPRDVFRFVQIGIDIQSFYSNPVADVMPDREMGHEQRQNFLNKLAEIGNDAKAMGLEKTAVTIDCLISEYGTEHTHEQLKLSVKRLAALFREELKEHTFVQFDPARREYLKTREEFRTEPFWGHDVASNFSSAMDDLYDASLCYVTDRATACVFHCMRVLEIGLRTLARDLNVPFSIPFEYQDWSTIIDAIDAAIKAIEKQQPRGQAKTDKLQTYGDASLHFFHFKNAWRNYISHQRGPCTPEEAALVFRNVGDFMKCLARCGLKEVS